jgi:hypothetical protein
MRHEKSGEHHPITHTLNTFPPFVPQAVVVEVKCRPFRCKLLRAMRLGCSKVGFDGLAGSNSYIFVFLSFIILLFYYYFCFCLLSRDIVLFFLFTLAFITRFIYVILIIDGLSLH